VLLDVSRVHCAVVQYKLVVMIDAPRCLHSAVRRTKHRLSYLVICACFPNKLIIIMLIFKELLVDKNHAVMKMTPIEVLHGFVYLSVLAWGVAE